MALGTGAAFEAQAAPWLAGWPGAGAHDLFVADVNGDGRADLFAKERSATGRGFVALGTGTSFEVQAAPWLTGWGVGSAAFSLFVADVSGDGRADLVAKERVPPGRWLVALAGASTFTVQVRPWLRDWAAASAAHEYFVADVTEDGIADLVYMINLHHELEDPAAVMAEAFRLLKRGGMVLVMDWKAGETPSGQ